MYVERDKKREIRKSVKISYQRFDENMLPPLGGRWPIQL